MSDNKVTMKQVATDTGVPYSTIRSWNKKRPELVAFLFYTYDSRQVIIDMQSDIDALKDVIRQTNKLTAGV